MNTEQLTELLKEFAEKFPTIDFSTVTSFNNQIERLLVPHIKDFSAEQWGYILDSHYDNLFQDGCPHVDWNIDRGILARELIRQGAVVTNRYDETWYSVTVYCKEFDSVLLEIKIKEPIVWDQGRTEYSVSILKEKPIIPTHVAVILTIMDGKAYITKQLIGTLDVCENWVAKNIEKGSYFKILPL